MAQLEVVKDVAGQRIYFYPQLEGRPASTPTVAIKDKYGSTITAAADTYVTQSAVNTSLVSAASAGDTSVTLSDADDVEPGETYLIWNSLQQKELVRARSVNSTTDVVELYEPLELDHDSASFQGCFFYYTLQSAEVDELVENYRARAVYTDVLGLIHTQEVPFDVVLTPLINPLTKKYISKYRPDLMSQQFAETLGDDLADLRDAAWDRVKEGIRAHATGWRPALLKTPDDVNQWALAEFDLLCIENGLDIYRNLEPIDQFEKAEQRRNNLQSSALASLSFMDLDDDDSYEEGEDKPLRMDFVR